MIAFLSGYIIKLGESKETHCRGKEILAACDIVVVCRLQLASLFNILPGSMEEEEEEEEDTHPINFKLSYSHIVSLVEYYIV